MMTEDCKSLCRRAKLAFARGDHAEARALYQQAIGLDAGSADAHYGLAATAYLLKDLREAAIHFQETIKLDPKRTGAYINLGAIMNRYERYGDAMRLLKRGLALDPKRVEGYCNLGAAYRKTNQLDKAVKCYREAARLKPELVDAQYNLGKLYLQLKDYVRAAERFETVLQLKPDLDSARAGLAEAQAQQARPSTPAPAPASLETDEPGLIPFDSAEQSVPDVPVPQEETVEAPPQAGLGDTASDTNSTGLNPNSTGLNPNSTGLNLNSTPATLPEIEIDPERKLDPKLHQELLQVVYQLAKETEEEGRRFLDVFEDQAPPVLKELGACLTHSRLLGINELEDRTQEFADLVDKVRTLHDAIQDKIRRIKDEGDRILHM